MKKGKFASLMMLSAFSAGVASSSAVSAQGDENLASVVDNKSASSYDDSVSIDPKVSNEPMFDADETNIDAETTIDEETQDDSTDEENNASADTEISDKDIEDKSDLSEDSAKQNSKNGVNLSVDNDKKQNVKKGNGVETVKGFAIAGIGASAVSGATFGISKLVKSSGNNKKDEPKPEPDPEPKPDPNKKEEKGGFGTWYKNNPLKAGLLTFVVGLIALYITFLVFYTIFVLIYMGVKKGNGYERKSWLGFGKVVDKKAFSHKPSYLDKVCCAILSGALKFQFVKIVKVKVEKVPDIYND